MATILIETGTTFNKAYEISYFFAKDRLELILNKLDQRTKLQTYKEDQKFPN